MSANPSGDLPETEFATVRALSADDRYAYAIERLLEHGEWWSLRDRSGWVLMQDEENAEILPVWPHERFALEFATGEWAEARPARIELESWIEDFLPAMVEQGRLVAVMPTPGDEGLDGVVVEAEELLAELEEELDEGDWQH